MECFEVFVGIFLVATASPSAAPQTTSSELWTNSALWTAIIGALVTVAGWFAVRLLENRQKGIERELKYCERQIEEFYGPLFNLMEQIFSAEEVQQNFIDASSDQEDKIRDYFQENYFLPFHNEMIQILKAKLYLIEGAAVPPSFREYVKHACDDRARRVLKIWPRTLFPWPPDFEDHLTLGLKHVMEKYDGLIRRLETSKGTLFGQTSSGSSRSKSRRTRV